VSRPKFSVLRVVMCALLASPSLAQEPYGESIDVVRYVVNVRVTDIGGKAITDLAPEDFRVKLGLTTAVVESATWNGSGARAPAPDTSVNRESPAEEMTPTEAEPGRLIVLFVLTDFGRDPKRMAGQIAFSPMAAQILDELAPDDRVAVLQHDSHFKMRLDFTTDRAAIRKAIRESIRIELKPLPPPLPGPSLARHLDHAAMRKSASAETSLLMIAQALEQIDGQKLILMAGWGLGERLSPWVVFSEDWNRAIGLLRRDKIPIISVNTGVGGELTAGLVASSLQTGGAYAGTTLQLFPQQVTLRVIGALAGSYELVIRSDKALGPGNHALHVRTARRGARVIAPLTVYVRQASAEDPIWQAAQPPPGDETPKADAWTIYSSALRHLRNEEPDDAAKLLDEVIAMDGNYALAWYERGMLAAGRSDNEAARRDLGKYLELEPRGTYAYDVREMLRKLDALH